LQVSWVVQEPLQQSQEALQDCVGSLQMSPSGLQPIGFWQRPKAKGGVIAQVTGMLDWPGSPTLPQQSLSFVQMSPTGRHPDEGKQTSTPVGV
jgi:hypothetical protein